MRRRLDLTASLIGQKPSKNFGTVKVHFNWNK
jgi:hypothetical protein